MKPRADILARHSTRNKAEKMLCVQCKRWRTVREERGCEKRVREIGDRRNGPKVRHDGGDFVQTCTRASAGLSKRGGQASAV